MREVFKLEVHKVTKVHEAEYNGKNYWRYEPKGSTGIYPPMCACNEMNLLIIERGQDESWFIQYFSNDKEIALHIINNRKTDIIFNLLTHYLN